MNIVEVKVEVEDPESGEAFTVHARNQEEAETVLTERFGSEDPTRLGDVHVPPS